MIIYDLLFYVFAALMIFSAVGVVSVKNPVYSVLLLIFTFFNAAAIFILLGAEFLAMAMIIVYAGAIAVLFLFVVMMLNIKTSQIKQCAISHHKLLISVVVLLLAELIAVIYLSLHPQPEIATSQNPLIIDGLKDNTYQLGFVFYTKYVYLFQICGVILFVAIISSIILTFRNSKNIKKQDINSQMSRTKESSIKLATIKTGDGVNAIHRK
jgi:NADH-quinone oxidoreductase subunit J